MFEYGTGDHRVEHDRHMRGLYFSRAQSAQGAACGFFPYLLRRVELCQAARYRIPVISLHGAVFVLSDGYSRARTVGPPVFTDKTMRIRQNFSAGSGVERSAVGVLDARVNIKRGL